MPEELADDEIAGILGILGKASPEEADRIEKIAEYAVSSRSYDISAPDRASLHWAVSTEHLFDSARERYAEKVIELYGVDLSSMESDANRWLYKRLFTDWHRIESTLARFFTQLNGTSASSTDFARDVMRSYGQCIAGNVDFASRHEDASCLIEDYPEPREWFQPPFGDRSSWVKLAYAIERNDIRLILASSCSILEALQRHRESGFE